MATRTSFRTVENKQFKAFVQKLRPGTETPSRKYVSEKLLDEIYEQEKGDVSTVVSGKDVTLQIDELPTIGNVPVVDVAFAVAVQTDLANTIDTMGVPNSADNLLEIVKEQKSYIETEFQVRVSSLMTDNAANMAKIRREFSSLGIHVYGCSAHFADLLAKDICSTEV